MTRHSEHFEDLLLEDAEFSGPGIDGGTLRLSVLRNLMVLWGHPLAGKQGEFYADGFTLVFENVVRSKRRLFPYVENSAGEGLGPVKTLSDGPFPDFQGPTRVYEVTGVLKEENAWIDSWEIEAGAFFLEEPAGPWQHHRDATLDKGVEDSPKR